MNTFQCYICRNNIPEAFGNEHHKRPQAAGGTEKDLLNLCAGCHQNLHRIADMLMCNKASLADDTAKIYYKDFGQRERLFELANLVVEWMLAKKEGEITGKDEVKVVVVLPLKVKMALQLMANERKGPTGRKLGLMPFLRSLLCNVVQNKFPKL